MIFVHNSHNFEFGYANIDDILKGNRRNFYSKFKANENLRSYANFNKLENDNYNLKSFIFNYGIFSLSSYLYDSVVEGTMYPQFTATVNELSYFYSTSLFKYKNKYKTIKQTSKSTIEKLHYLSNLYK